MPATALVERAGVSRVYVAREGVAEARIVEVVERNGENVWVDGDLSDGDQVLVEPGRDVADGVSIEAHQVAANRPLSDNDPNPQPNDVEG